jgi:hypothetical protein
LTLVLIELPNNNDCNPLRNARADPFCTLRSHWNPWCKVLPTLSLDVGKKCQKSQNRDFFRVKIKNHPVGHGFFKAIVAVLADADLMQVARAKTGCEGKTG